MTINDIMSSHITPFEISDKKLLSLFSYYLHLAPTIGSSSAKSPPTCGLEIAWQQFITEVSLIKPNYHIYAPGYIKPSQLELYNLADTDVVKKNSRRFVCCYKDDESQEIVCLLRHIRNSIAHSNIYLLDTKNRKYLIFDDYNKSENLTARILLSQTDLSRLRKVLSH